MFVPFLPLLSAHQVSLRQRWLAALFLVLLGLTSLALLQVLRAELHPTTGFNADLGLALLIFTGTIVATALVGHQRPWASETSDNGDPGTCCVATDDHVTPEAPTVVRQGFQILTDNNRDGILILEVATGRITMANRFICELLGYTKDDLVGRYLWDLGAFQDKQLAIHAYTQLLEKGCFRHIDMPLIHKNGTVVQVGLEANVYRPGSHDVIQCHIRPLSLATLPVPEVNSLRYQQDLMRSLREIVAALVMLNEQRDPYTAGHEARVSELSVAIGKELGLKRHDLEGLRISGLLHDLGKFTIPIEILTKPGRVSPEEMALIRTHVRSGYEVLKGIHFPWAVADVVLQHHERLDGSGYPHQLQGDQIGLMGRILAVADTVESMSTDRPYRFSPGLDKALEAIEAGKGRLYDANVVDACLRLFRERGYDLPKRRVEPSWSTRPGNIPATTQPELPVTVTPVGVHAV